MICTGAQVLLCFRNRFEFFPQISLLSCARFDRTARIKFSCRFAKQLLESITMMYANIEAASDFVRQGFERLLPVCHARRRGQI